MKDGGKRMYRRFFAVAVGVTLLSSAARGADVERLEATSRRSEQRAAVTVGLNDPVPAVAGISVGYNVLDFLRLTAGVGRFNSDYEYNGITLKTRSVTYGAGVRFLVPGWNLSPVVGVSWATIATEGFPNDDHHVYAVGGLEWQTDFGLNIGAGYERSFDAKIGGLPYLNVGWYIGLL